jgi:hypothetical protein
MLAKISMQVTQKKIDFNAEALLMSNLLILFHCDKYKKYFMYICADNVFWDISSDNKYSKTSGASQNRYSKAS